MKKKRCIQEIKPKNIIRITIAGINIILCTKYIDTIDLFSNYLCAFKEADLRITLIESEIGNERKKDLLSLGFHIDKNVAISQNNSYFESTIIQRKIANAMLSFDTFLMHGSVVAKDGYAYMFTAPSGVGKTTRTRLWLDLYPDSIVVNGDKPLIKVTPTEAIACGTPWCGKEGWNTNTMVPLRAIFLLERADEGEESSIQEISLGKAFPFLLQQTHIPEDPDLMRKTLQLLKSLEDKVKIYKFRSTPTEESVRLAYETA